MEQRTILYRLTYMRPNFLGLPTNQEDVAPRAPNHNRSALDTANLQSNLMTMTPLCHQPEAKAAKHRHNLSILISTGGANVESSYTL